MSTQFDKRDVAMRQAATESMSLYWHLVGASLAADEMGDDGYHHELSEAASQVHAATAFVREHVEWLDNQPFRLRWNARRVLSVITTRFAANAAVGAFLAVVWLWTAVVTLMVVMQ